MTESTIRSDAIQHPIFSSPAPLPLYISLAPLPASLEMRQRAPQNPLDERPSLHDEKHRAKLGCDGGSKPDKDTKEDQPEGLTCTNADSGDRPCAAEQSAESGTSTRVCEAKRVLVRHVLRCVCVRARDVVSSQMLGQGDSVA